MPNLYPRPPHGNGRRVLVFSQFTGILSIITAALDEAGLRYVTLTGDTKDRKLHISAEGDWLFRDVIERTGRQDWRCT